MNIKLNAKTILSFTWTLFALGGKAQAEELKPLYTEVTAASSLDGKAVGESIYLSLPLKINSRYMLTPEVSTSITNRDKGVNNFSVSHDYLRIVFNDAGLPSLGDWKLGMTYRYRAPTTSALQAAGSFGGLMFRPQVATKFGDLALKFRLPVEVYLQRQPYQVSPKAGEAAKANTLLSSALEILTSYPVTPELSFAPTFTLSQNLAAGSKNPKKWTHKFGYNFELDYQGAATFGTTVGLYVDYGSEFGNGADFKLASKEMTVALVLKRDLY